MRFNILNFKSLTLFVLLIHTSIFLKAESKKDTLVYVTNHGTTRQLKAQVFEAENDQSLLYYRPRPFDFVRYVPNDIYQLGKTAFSKKNLPKFGAILAGTAALIAVDQHITDAAQQFGRFIHLSPAHEFKRVEVFKIPVIDLPGNLNAAFYFMGEGWPSMLIAGSFYGYGLMAQDYRALQTTSQLTEMFFTLAITTQLIKRITGRESAFVATSPGGTWHPLQNPGYYQKHVAESDAFPSGHLATAMATVTILAGNYPDNKYIKPIGYSLMGLLGYSMLNNGVHWMSDFPLAIAIGYTCGRIALSRGQKMISKKATVSGKTSSLTPVYLYNGGLGLKYQLTF